MSGVRSTGTAEDVAIPPAKSNNSPVVNETVDTSSTTTTDKDSDETLDYFSKLAEEDE